MTHRHPEFGDRYSVFLLYACLYRTPRQPAARPASAHRGRPDAGAGGRDMRHRATSSVRYSCILETERDGAQTASPSPRDESRLRPSPRDESRLSPSPRDESRLSSVETTAVDHTPHRRSGPHGSQLSSQVSHETRVTTAQSARVSASGSRPDTSRRVPTAVTRHSAKHAHRAFRRLPAPPGRASAHRSPHGRSISPLYTRIVTARPHASVVVR